MIYIPEKTLLTFVPKMESVTCFQEISSEIRFGNLVRKQALEKKLKIDVSPLETFFLKVSITTSEMKLELDSILKKQENLSRDIAGILEKIQFKVNKNGELIEILNYLEILSKWYSVKKKLVSRYKGQAIERFLIGIEKKIENPKKLLADCKQYRLYGLLFNNMHGQAYSNDALEAVCRMQILQNACYQLPLVLQEKLTLAEDNEQKIRVAINGKLIENQPYARKINNHFKRQGITVAGGIQLDQYEGSYEYHTKSAVLENMELLMETSFGGAYQKRQFFSIKKII